MKKITLIVSVLLFFFTALASAHGPVRQKAEKTITINAPADKGCDYQKLWGYVLASRYF